MSIVHEPASNGILEDKCKDSGSPSMDPETIHSDQHESLGTEPTSNSENVPETNELRQRRRPADNAETSTDQATTTARSDKGKAPANLSASSEPKQEASDEFSCNICFDTATDPVLTLCGHLFCWSCLVQWLERSATCPVCKAGCDKDKVIPVYGRGKEEKDPRQTPAMPNRPHGQRPPPPLPRQANQFFGFDPFGVPGSFHGVGMGRGGAVFVGGFGFLPALMGLSAFAGAQAGNVQANGQPAGRQAFASRVLMMLAVMILMSILFY